MKKENYIQARKRIRKELNLPAWPRGRLCPKFEEKEWQDVFRKCTLEIEYGDLKYEVE